MASKIATKLIYEYKLAELGPSLPKDNEIRGDLITFTCF